ncbi:MAG: hypothetical protein CVV05_07605 [Gammaproteobacteria bacterium HGW-Gammaproteobacteria-1]|jgi:hypothetical protein|nr:MAG: hypothetical protein CVV05_07605 [Gammaproteobacteria bacterium HGW-Gammaproteobacteria-1]
MKYLLFLPLLLSCGVAGAADGGLRHGFWGNIDIGFGNLYLSPDVARSRTDSRLYLALAGGYAFHPQLQLGIAAGGWNIEASNFWDTASGEGLRQVFAVVRYWPTAESKLYLSFAGGSVTHWNNADGAADGTGNGYSVGLGYEVVRYAAMGTHVFLDYSRGSVDGYRPPGGVSQGEDYSAFTVGLRLGF